MIEITYLSTFLFITFAWIAIRIFIRLKTKDFDIKRELLLITVYICLIVIARIVYFPFHLVDGQIQPLIFDPTKIIPPWINLKPFVFLTERYDGWIINVIGNLTMFIPVGICWPLCFKKLDNIAKAVAACGGLSLFIEMTQLIFYERATDIDDLILNTSGAAIGVIIFFIIKRITYIKIKEGRAK